MLPSTSDIEFFIRVITWSEYELVTPILLQEENGPCPLIALVNTLLLQTEITNRNNQLNGDHNSETVEEVLSFKTYLKGRPTIKLDDLLSQLGHLLIKFNENKIGYDLSKLLESLPLLHTGLSVNPNLTDGTFEQDLAVDLFSIFDLKFAHGWVIEPQSTLKISELKFFDYIQDYLVSTDDEQVKTWLNENSAQLTTYGRSLLDKFGNDEFIVFFRNNHFNTLYKKNGNDLYLLLTDSSFNKSTKIVWQSLISVNGNDDLFFAGDFTPVMEEMSNDLSNMNIEDENFKLIKQLQEEDDQEYAKKLQKSYEKKLPPVKEEIKKNSKSKKPSKDSSTKKNKKSNCVIV